MLRSPIITSRLNVGRTYKATHVLTVTKYDNVCHFRKNIRKATVKCCTRNCFPALGRQVHVSPCLSISHLMISNGLPPFCLRADARSCLTSGALRFTEVLRCHRRSCRLQLLPGNLSRTLMRSFTIGRINLRRGRRSRRVMGRTTAFFGQCHPAAD